MVFLEFFTKREYFKIERMKEKDPWHRPRYRVRAMMECIRNFLNEAKWCEECIRRECWQAEECKKKLRRIKEVFEEYAEHLGITLLFTIDIEQWRVQPYQKLFEEKVYIIEPIKAESQKTSRPLFIVKGTIVW